MALGLSYVPIFKPSGEHALDILRVVGHDQLLVHVLVDISSSQLLMTFVEEIEKSIVVLRFDDSVQVEKTEGSNTR